MASWELHEKIASFLYREGDLLDRRQWQDWLALFTPDVEYWVPAWDSDSYVTQDPKREVSLFFIEGRKTLEYRVWRFTSGESAASVPLPRTAHHVTNIEVTDEKDGLVFAKAKWLTHAYKKQEQAFFGGSSEYALLPQGDSFLIKRKKSIMINDVVNIAVDLYHL
jgi:3-phenylpropionate/cinnamic acid dioxygenase small subunit